MPIKRIGLFGGTFDPLHKGHLWAARAAQRELKLDTVIFIPAAIPPHKKGIPLATPQDRLEMLRLALVNLNGFRISLHDLRRSGPAYSVDLIRYFKKRYPRALLFFIMGSDSLIEFPRWKRFREILRLCKLVVIPRPSFPVRYLPSLIRRQVYWIKTRGSPVSSTRLRHLFSRGKGVQGFLPPSVAGYIRRKSLYESAS